MCDRNTTIESVSQVGFVDFIVTPAYNVWQRLLPSVAGVFMPLLAANRERWHEEGERAVLAAAHEGGEEETTSGVSLEGVTLEDAKN